MKNKAWYGFFGVMVLLFAVSCSFDPEYNLQGTWENDDGLRITFDGNDYTIETGTAGIWVSVQRGTFEASGGKIKFTPTFLTGGGDLVSYEEDYSLSFLGLGGTLTLGDVEFTFKK
ncbi:MAG: hypothetical protein LBQ77_00180 [Treponema sp.]|jgi:hypothetical protein|nr:hypothetical protein [Treponema sp.]